MEAVVAGGATGGAGLPAGGDVEPAGFFSLTRFSDSLATKDTVNSSYLDDWMIISKTDAGKSCCKKWYARLLTRCHSSSKG